MEKSHFNKFAALLLMCCAMLGCGKDKNQGSVYGTVTDYTTGDPISNANVRLNPRGETTLTGSDGTFQFYDLSNGKYSLSLSKNGYADLDDDYVIEIENGNSVRRDVQLKIGVESFKITVNGVETDTLYFSSDNDFVTFLVTNNGTIQTTIHGSTSSDHLHLRYKGDHWSSSELQPNQGVSIVADLYWQYNNGYIYINSSQVSKTLVCIRRS